MTAVPLGETTGPTESALRLVVRCALLGVAIVLSGLLISRYDARAGDDNYLAAVLEKDRPHPDYTVAQDHSGRWVEPGVRDRRRLMQDSLHVSVVNMGLYAKLGLRYMLAQVKPSIRAGDIVVVVPEYDQFYGSFSEGDNTLNTALLYAPADRISDFVKSYSVIDVVFRPRVENVRRAFLVAVADVVGFKDKYFPPGHEPGVQSPLVQPLRRRRQPSREEEQESRLDLRQGAPAARRSSIPERSMS